MQTLYYKNGVPMPLEVYIKWTYATGSIHIPKNIPFPNYIYSSAHTIYSFQFHTMYSILDTTILYIPLSIPLCTPYYILPYCIVLLLTSHRAYTRCYKLYIHSSQIYFFSNSMIYYFRNNILHAVFPNNILYTSIFQTM